MPVSASRARAGETKFFDPVTDGCKEPAVAASSESDHSLDQGRDLQVVLNQDWVTPVLRLRPCRLIPRSTEDPTRTRKPVG